MYTVWTKRCVCTASKFHIVNLDTVRQLLALVPQPVKALVLLFPIRGKLKELSEEEEAKIKEKGQVPIDPTVFWIKQTVRPSLSKAQYIKLVRDRSITHAVQLACCMP